MSHDDDPISYVGYRRAENKDRFLKSKRVIKEPDLFYLTAGLLCSSKDS